MNALTFTFYLYQMNSLPSSFYKEITIYNVAPTYLNNKYRNIYSDQPCVRILTSLICDVQTERYNHESGLSWEPIGLNIRYE